MKTYKEHLDEIKKEEQKYCTVQDLINYLSKYSKDLPVGRLGYFGEFVALDPDDLKYGHPVVEAAPVPADKSWRHADYKNKIKIFDLTNIVSDLDIGEEPD